MHTTKDLHQTGDKVIESGHYIDKDGEHVDFKQGEVFPNCPKTDQPTTWRHANHEHQTGDKVTETGHYVDKDGEHVDFKQGEVFPNCPKTNQPTTWRHA
ncbi:hypothetical protein ACQKJG_22845 [Priestia megaterium]|uniref:hypothetical protein n=1 Tax=Priestia TaxID=2800373 RepID=UPI001C8DF160|nr:hypothetical protein [Priestia aryabhattai]MBY0029814.1 hypothetical protein [Priestia aryabhattai]